MAAFMTSEETKEFIEEVYENVFENMDADEAMVRKYFDESYEQHIDARILNFTAFLNTISHQKENFNSIELNIEELIVENDKCVSYHHSTFVKKTGEEINLRVILIFTIRDRKIVSTNGLTMGEIHKVLHPKHERHGHHHH